MRTFRTVVNVEKSKFEITHRDNILMLGSCFVENIGTKLLHYKFTTLVNPFGILYNPASVGQAIRFFIDKKKFTKSDLEFANEKWFSFYHHGRFSDRSADACLQKINKEASAAYLLLSKTDKLFITFGTSWVYKLKRDNKIVANNHKLPSNLFQRELLSVDDICRTYEVLIKELHAIAPGLQIIFTVSPIRHWKDGARGNQISKSILQLASKQLEDKFEQVSYFPSYEIVLDDLRDYRFYESDMLHPNQLAVDYIWERFAEAYFMEQTLAICEKSGKISQAVQHRPFDTQTIAFKTFVNKNLQLIEKLKMEYPYINLDKETTYFANVIKNTDIL